MGSEIDCPIHETFGMTEANFGTSAMIVCIDLNRDFENEMNRKVEPTGSLYMAIQFHQTTRINLG